jgi:hypothetical protein
VHSNAFLKGVVNGWELSGVTQLQSGAPIQPNTNEILGAQYGTNVSNSGYLGTNAIGLVPKLTCDPRSGLASGQYFNANCFSVPAAGTNGDVIWPYIKGPRFFNSDLSLYKNFKITESKSVQFRLQAFNFLNHPNKQFGVSGNDLNLNFKDSNGNSVSTNQNSATNGIPAHGVGDRLVELAVKFYF